MRNFNLKNFTLLFLTLILVGCSNPKKTEEVYLTEAKTQFDEKKYDESIKTYRDFIKDYPKSDKAIYAYNQIAGIQIDAMKNPQEGIKTYKELAEKFPSTKEAKQGLFMVAFIYDETLKDKDNAVKAYEEFLKKYPTDTDPNDKMSESAKTMLEVLKSGKSIEEMIQQNIEKMGNQGKTDSMKVEGIEEKNVTPPSKDIKESGIQKKEDPRMPANKEERKKAGEDPASDTKNKE